MEAARYRTPPATKEKKAESTNSRAHDGKENARNVDEGDDIEAGEATYYDATPFFESAGGDEEPPVAMMTSLSVCIECRTTPSTHKCRKCRHFVCDPCCYEKRGLELTWWCGTCFDNESLTNQQQIREGKYESDNKSGDVVVVPSSTSRFKK
jgi:hypothetical protein